MAMIIQLYCEIGFGMENRSWIWLFLIPTKLPWHWKFIWCYACIAYAVEKGVTNLRVICHDATEIYETVLQMVHLAVCNYFPDLWHKAKHHKRRIVQPHFVTQVVYKN